MQIDETSTTVASPEAMKLLANERMKKTRRKLKPSHAARKKKALRRFIRLDPRAAILHQVKNLDC